jgi:hypothetical protein
MKDLRLSLGVAPVSAFPNGVGERGSHHSLQANGANHASDDQLIEKDYGVKQEQQKIEMQARGRAKRGAEMTNIEGNAGYIEGNDGHRYERHRKKISERRQNESERDGKNQDHEDVALVVQGTIHQRHLTREVDSEPPDETNAKRWWWNNSPRGRGFRLVHDDLGLAPARGEGNAGVADDRRGMTFLHLLS